MRVSGECDSCRETRGRDKGKAAKQVYASAGDHMAPSAAIGIVWPPLAAPGVNVCQRSLNRTSACPDQSRVVDNRMKASTYREGARRTCTVGTWLMIGAISSGEGRRRFVCDDVPIAVSASCTCANWTTPQPFDRVPSYRISASST